MRCLIKNGYLHQFNATKSSFIRGNLIIHDDYIEELSGCCPPEQSFDKVIDATDCLIIPGLINAHIHTHCHFVKGLFDNLPLEMWMLYTKPYFTGRVETPDDVYIKALFSCIEILKTGTTMIIDDLVHCPTFSPQHYSMIMKAYKKAGLRADVSVNIINKPAYETIPYLDELMNDNLKTRLRAGAMPPEREILQYLEGLIRQYNVPDAVQRCVLAPSGPQRCTVPLMKGMRDLAEKYHLPVVSHVLETRVQKETGQLFFGKSLVEWMNENDLLYPNLLAIHSVWVTDEDIQLMKQSGCKTVHNPASNLKLGSGIAPVGRLLREGITVGLGTDNTSCSDSLNMFESLKLSALLQKIQTPDYENWIGAQEAIRMATYNGAECACLQNKIGSIQVGQKADIVIIDTNNERLLPANNYVNQLVFCENGQSVRDVIINGRIVVENKKIVTFNEAEVIEEFKQVMNRMKEQRELAGKEAAEVDNLYREAYYKTIRHGDHHKSSSV